MKVSGKFKVARVYYIHKSGFHVCQQLSNLLPFILCCNVTNTHTGYYEAVRVEMSGMVASISKGVGSCMSPS